MSKRHIAIFAICAVTLSGCSTLQKLNPFKHKSLKAPCNAVASIGPGSVTCEGKTINYGTPSIEELHQLRGLMNPDTGRAYGIMQAAP